MIMDKYLWMDFTYIVKNNVYKLIYAYIAIACINNNCYYPNKVISKDNRDKRLNRIVTLYCAFPKKLLTDMNSRIKKYPISVSWDYLTKVLLNEVVDNANEQTNYVVEL